MPGNIASLEVKDKEFSFEDMLNLKQRCSIHKQISETGVQNSHGSAEKRKYHPGERHRDKEHGFRNKLLGPSTF